MCLMHTVQLSTSEDDWMNTRVFVYFDICVCVYMHACSDPQWDYFCSLFDAGDSQAAPNHGGCLLLHWEQTPLPPSLIPAFNPSVPFLTFCLCVTLTVQQRIDVSLLFYLCWRNMTWNKWKSIFFRWRFLSETETLLQVIQWLYLYLFLKDSSRLPQWSLTKHLDNELPLLLLSGVFPF